MFLCFGWAIIQSSQKAYVGIDPCSSEVDDLDDHIREADHLLMAEFETWLKAQDTPIKYQFTHYLNNHSGLFQFHSSTNHRSRETEELVEFIANQSKGSYGLVYVHDDEHGSEFELEVWRILDGQITHHCDQFISPFNSKHAFGGTNYWMEEN